MDALKHALKVDWPVYLSSAAIVVPVLSWLLKWLGLLTGSGSTLAEAIVLCVALPCFMRLLAVRVKDEGEA